MKYDNGAATTEFQPGERIPGLGASHLETVLYPRPRCPECDGTRLKKYRSIADQGDGSALWWVRCANEECGHKFKVLLE